MANMPYFPVAYIPILPVSSAKSRAILDATLVSDWTLNPAANRLAKEVRLSGTATGHSTTLSSRSQKSSGPAI